MKKKNEWTVIELSDLEWIMEDYKAKLKLAYVIKRKWWNHFFIGFAVEILVVLLGISVFTFMFL